MPVKKVRVRDHDRRRPRSCKTLHVNRYMREQTVSSRPAYRAEDLGPIPRQYDLEEALGPEVDVFDRSDPEGEICQVCGWQRPVYQRDVSGVPICQECHLDQVQSHVERRKERERREKETDQRLREWERWQRGGIP